MNHKLNTILAWSLLAATLTNGLSGCFPVVAASAGAGALLAADRRTSGTYVEDEGIEWKVQNRASDRFGDRVHVNAVSFNRIVLLAGEAPDEATREELTRIAQGVPNVRNVVNEVRIGANTSLSNRANDAALTSKVKARFVDQATFGVQHVKVYTEAGTVFLMGTVTRREADAATDLARTTSGVSKVVRVFEYLGEEDARRLDGQAAQGQSPAGGGAEVHPIR
ncbi:MAG: BON domain-containing protein [Rhodocyclaceae bacterium]|jgi:osmotically-inducible protein OsmY|nr:BON domain-containing protein [Rhodocyclaceae bacterium]